MAFTETFLRCFSDLTYPQVMTKYPEQRPS